MRYGRGVILLLLVSACGAQHGADGREAATQAAEGSPEWIVEQFFLADTFPARERYLGGEMAEHDADAPTLGSTLPANVRGVYRRLEQSGGRAVFAVTLTDGKHANDWYAYLSEGEGGWTLDAVRTLALPPFFYLRMDSLSRAASLTESAAMALENMRLTVQSDSMLKAYFAENAAELEALSEEFRALPALRTARADGTTDPEAPPGAASAEITRRLRALRLSAIYRDPQHPGCIFVSIGGVLDNQVGYIHAPDGCAVPSMDPSSFIYVEQVREGWYLFKTT